MYRDIFLRTAVSEKSDTQSVKLIDSRGKKSTNSKISIYSQKYTNTTNVLQRQDLKIHRASDKKTQESPAANPANPNIRQAIQLQLRKQDNHVRQTSSQIVSQQAAFPITANFECAQNKQEKFHIDAVLAASFKDHLEAVRMYYEGKIKQILQDSGKAISELRNLLVHQQHRLAEKQDQINKLISAQQGKTANGRCLPIRFESPHKSKVINANASYEYLCNKVKDLDVNVKLIMEQFIDSEDQVKNKIQKVQNQFIRYFAEKLGSCQFRLTKFIQKLQRKCSGFQNYILQIDRQSTKNGLNIDIDIYYNKLSSQLRQKINQFSQDILNFSKKQYKYQNERVQSLQNILIELLAKFGAIQNRHSLRGSRRSNNGYYLQDEDQFFYPSSDRKVYQNNDDYEHFQSESDDDHPNLTKENISNNMQTCLLEKMKKI